MRFLNRAHGARCEVFPSLALGEDVRLDGDGVVGSALVYQDIPVHVGLFRVRGNASLTGERIASASTLQC
ncbi:MAG: hypothetical protein HY331_15450 [Chloroflexi bacterium]|nr:hypothetical protein [Chloroflexota bacterium]